MKHLTQLKTTYIRQKQNDYVIKYKYRRILCHLCNEISAIFGGGGMMYYRPLPIRHLGGRVPLSSAGFTPLGISTVNAQFSPHWGMWTKPCSFSNLYTGWPKRHLSPPVVIAGTRYRHQVGGTLLQRCDVVLRMLCKRGILHQSKYTRSRWLNNFQITAF